MGVIRSILCIELKREIIIDATEQIFDTSRIALFAFREMAVA